MSLNALTPEERKSLLLSVGTHRGARVLSPIEAARLMRKVVDAGTPMSVCAEELHLSGATWVGRFLSLLKLPEDVQDLIDWGRSDRTIAFTSATELSRLTDSADQRNGAHAVLQYDLTTLEVRQLVQARKRSGKSIEECVKIVLKMRPQVEVRHVFIGSIREDIRANLRRLSQQRRDEILQAILERTLKDLHSSGRLGTERFTLVGRAELGEAVNSRKEEIERQINDELAGISE